MNKLAKALLVAGLLTTLSGCVEMVVGSAVVSGFAAADRRTIGAQTEDKAITFKAEARVPKVVGDAGHVNITSYNRRALITGEVRDEAMKRAVEREVAAIEGVTAVSNELEIAGASSLTSRSNDALITTKVMATLVDTKTISSTTFKVVTERGVVYLMGRVSPREGTVAAEAVRSVSGVNKVVKIFDYIAEEEVQALNARSGDKQGGK
ncbi:BON domain-containing protein [Massilia sp. TS11]|uniref:BON domain-containing protein n=1 Tax=Massilia sp. TS11 TaxID=2908003 RepID=UPI001EDBA18E|nr:BON domain-containing protein [Massilia sp. TS11]MCG2585180.1 BON domain-containing protein [Massilia sp. TS11]